jgi:hypothetical protein
MMRLATLIASFAAASSAFLWSAAVVRKPLGPSPVVVELFTSQGCSSCPPADELIRKIAADESLRGRVIPLAYHVDYWDHLGWRDAFSSAEWSQRQITYTRALHLDSPYTPQVVVNGSRQFVGSNAVALNASVEEASRQKPVGSVALDVRREGEKIEAVIRADAPSNSDVVVVLFQNDVATRIERGENEGRTASETAIVRRLLRAGTGSVSKSVTIDIDPAWKHLGIAAFVQDRATLAITTATVHDLSD